jgi:acyl carrier protein
MMTTTREQVREYINGKLLGGEGEAIHIEDSTSMINSGLINSMAIVELIAYVEDTFQISVADHDINIGDFDSIDSICSLIARRQART